MRRAAATLYILAALLCLTGCENHLFSSRRDMEHLRPVQTLGLDRQPDGVILSISTGIGPEKAPALVMKAAAPGIEAAIGRLQDYVPEDELFYAHVQYVLLGGSGAGRAIDGLLDWVERSPAMRMDVPLLLVSGTAAGAVTGADGQSADVTARLASLERAALEAGRHIYTLRETASSLLAHGCALCLAVGARPTDGVVYGEAAGADAIVPLGYAVLSEDAPPAYLTEEETLGAELLHGGMNGAHITVADSVLEIVTGSAELRPQPDGGVLIRCELTAGVLERGQEGGGDPRGTEAALAAAAEEWLRAVLARQRALGLDFLDLGARAFSEPAAVQAEARIVTGYDLAD